MESCVALYLDVMKSTIDGGEPPLTGWLFFMVPLLAPTFSIISLLFSSSSPHFVSVEFLPYFLSFSHLCWDSIYGFETMLCSLV